MIAENEKALEEAKKDLTILFAQLVRYQYNNYSCKLESLIQIRVTLVSNATGLDLLTQRCHRHARSAGDVPRVQRASSMAPPEANCLRDSNLARGMIKIMFGNSHLQYYNMCLSTMYKGWYIRSSYSAGDWGNAFNSLPSG